MDLGVFDIVLSISKPRNRKWATTLISDDSFKVWKRRWQFVSFLMKKLKIRHYIHQHRIIWSRIPDNHLTWAFGRVRDSYFESGLKTGWCRNWVQVTGGGTSSRYRCLQFWNKRICLPRSESGRACGHDFHQTSLLGQQPSLRKRRPAWKEQPRLKSFSQQKKSQRCFWCFGNRTVGGCSKRCGFHNIPQLKAGQLALDGAMMAGVEIQGYRDRVSSHAARQIWELIR